MEVMWIPTHNSCVESTVIGVFKGTVLIEPATKVEVTGWL